MSRATPIVGPNMRNALYEWQHMIRDAERPRPDPLYGDAIMLPGDTTARETWRRPDCLRNIPGGMRAAALSRLAKAGLMERRRTSASRWEYRMAAAGWDWLRHNS